MTPLSSKSQLIDLLDTLSPAQQRHLLEIARRWREGVTAQTTPPVNRACLGHEDPRSASPATAYQSDPRFERDEP